MNSREIALTGLLIALAWSVHYLMRFTGSITGELQFGIAISFYCLIVLLIRMSLSEASIVGLAAGLALATATAAPFPLANVPAHMAGIISCKIAADRLKGEDGSLRPAAVSAAVVMATAASFAAFVLASYYGILSFPELARGGAGIVEAIADGRVGLAAFVTPSLMKVGLPTMASNAILSPILYAGALWIRSRRPP